MFINSVFYVLGFSVIFAILGLILNTTLVNISAQAQQWIYYVGGTVIMAFGLYMTGLLPLSFLEKEYKIGVKQFKSSYLMSFLFGAAFAVGWSPCVGAVLGSIFVLAASTPSTALILLLLYALGLGIPFLLVGIFYNEAAYWIRKLGPYTKYFNVIVGILVILLGILVFTNTLNYFANFGMVQACFG